MIRLRDLKSFCLGIAIIFSLIAARLASTQTLDSPLFYNVIQITDPAGDATPRAPAYVDILKVTVRQIGQYVQFVWQAAGNPNNNDNMYYFLVFDTDFNPMTGQNWGGSGGELKISIYHDADVNYFDATGQVTHQEFGLPVVFDGNRFYLNFEKSKIPGNSFNFYFESSGATSYRDPANYSGSTFNPRSRM